MWESQASSHQVSVPRYRLSTYGPAFLLLDRRSETDCPQTFRIWTPSECSVNCVTDSRRRRFFRSTSVFSILLFNYCLVDKPSLSPSSLSLSHWRFGARNAMDEFTFDVWVTNCYPFNFVSRRWFDSSINQSIKTGLYSAVCRKRIRGARDGRD